MAGSLALLALSAIGTSVLLLLNNRGPRVSSECMPGEVSCRRCTNRTLPFLLVPAAEGGGGRRRPGEAPRRRAEPLRGARGPVPAAAAEQGAGACCSSAFLTRTRARLAAVFFTASPTVLCPCRPAAPPNACALRQRRQMGPSARPAQHWQRRRAGRRQRWRTRARHGPRRGHRPGLRPGCSRAGVRGRERWTWSSRRWCSTESAAQTRAHG